MFHKKHYKVIKKIKNANGKKYVTNLDTIKLFSKKET